jgi:hypothetical protein
MLLYLVTAYIEGGLYLIDADNKIRRIKFWP